MSYDLAILVWLGRTAQALEDEVPVHDVVENRPDEVASPVLVVQVIGMLPARGPCESKVETSSVI
jgi:hypothetical protein